MIEQSIWNNASKLILKNAYKLTDTKAYSVMAGSNSTPANVVKQIDEVSSSSSDSYCNSYTETPSSDYSKNWLLLLVHWPLLTWIVSIIILDEIHAHCSIA